MTPSPPEQNDTEQSGTERAPTEAVGTAPSPQPSAARRLFSRVIDVGLWLAVLGVVGLGLMPSRSGPSVGKPAAVVEVQTLEDAGARHRLPGELKRPLLIEAFASWCGACRRNARILDDLGAAREEGRLDLALVSVDDAPEEALAAKNSWPILAPVFFDVTGEFSRAYKVEVLPTYILIGTDGQVKRVTTGNPGASDIRAWLAEYDESKSQ